MTEQHDRAELARIAKHLARRLSKLERTVRRTAASPNTLNHAAIDGGELVVKDDQGNTKYHLGTDPVTGVTAPKFEPGPKPAQPEAPDLEAREGAVHVSLSGLDVDEQPAPADLKHAEIHMSLTEGFDVTPGTMVTSTQNPADGVSISKASGVWWVRVVWVTLSGQRSVPSEAVSVDIVPPVDAQDIQDTLDTAQAKLDEYRDEVAAPRFEALETGLEENTTSLSDARERLAEAEATLEPLPGEVAAAREDVEEARVKATEASAAAIEANNRSLTRLPNVNFDLGLQYWVTSDVTLSDDAHSGTTAALLANGGTLRPESATPVVAGQIWELSVYHKGDAGTLGASIWSQDEDGGYLETFENFTLQPAGSWQDSGTLRFTIPEGAYFLQFTLYATDGSWLVDDITLRDVTDVVRLEEAASDARRKAEDAEAKADALQLAVDGDGGLRDRLDTAEDDLENIDTQLDQVATNLDTALTGPVDHDRLRVGEGAFDEAFVGELWAGNIRALAAELARAIIAAPNLIPEDHFSGHRAIRDEETKTISKQGAGTETYTDTPKIVLEAGETYTFTARAYANRAGTQFRAQLYNPDGSTLANPIDQQELGTTPVEYEKTFTATQTGGHYFRLYWNHPHGNPTSNDVQYLVNPRIQNNLDGNLLVDGSITAEKIEATRELITHILGAEWAYVAEQLVVEGDLIAANIDAISASIEGLTVTERAEFAKAFAQEMWAALGVFDRLQAAEGWIGGVMLKDDTITTRHLEVTEDMVGRFAELLHLVVDRIDVNNLWADQTWQNAGYFGGTEGNYQTQVNGQGLSVWRQVEGEQQLATRLGPGENALSFFDEDTGRLNGSLSQDGSANLQETAVQSLNIAGRDLTHTPHEYQPGVPLLDSMPRGVWVAGPVDMSGVEVDRTHYGFLELTANVVQGRVYRVLTSNFLMGTDKSYQGMIWYTLSDDGMQVPTVNSTQLHRWIINAPTPGNVQEGGRALFEAPQTGIMRLLLGVRVGSLNDPGIRFNGLTTWAGDVQMWLEDLGPNKHAVSRRRFSGIGGAQPDYLDDTPGVQTYQTEWAAAWKSEYYNGGTTQRVAGNTLTQGYNPRYPDRGNWTSLAGFSGATNSTHTTEIGLSFQEATQGADIQSVEVILVGEGSLGDDPRFFVDLKWAPNSTAPGQYLHAPARLIASSRIDPGWERAVNVSEQYWPLLQTGDWQAIGLSKHSDQGSDRDGWIAWGNQRPRVRVTYQK